MKPSVLQFREIGDHRGTLVPIEGNASIPFAIKRVYYMYGTMHGVRRGLHAHKTLQQVLICINGSCDILLDNGHIQHTITLNSRSQGLYVAAHVWHEMYNFSSDAVLLALASDHYIESDYIRNYDQFLEVVQANVGPDSVSRLEITTRGGELN